MDGLRPAAHRRRDAQKRTVAYFFVSRVEHETNNSETEFYVLRFEGAGLTRVLRASGFEGLWLKGEGRFTCGFPGEGSLSVTSGLLSGLLLF